ncbi:TPA: hypothetical protein DCX15_04670 [bacterium]|nr:hypothetical protein [bacterium]
MEVNLEFPHIQVMSASAGAGKTHALSKRYIDFLLSSTIKTSPRNILAITFTNKAAMEMRSRVISDLKKIALGGSDRKEIAERCLDELLDRFSDLKIQTIDSFLTSITISSALELGLPPYSEIVLDSSPVFNIVFDELLSQVYPHGPKTDIFLDLLDELLQIEEGLSWDIKRIILNNISNLRKQKFLSGQKLKKVFSFEDMKEEREPLAESIRKFLEMAEDGLNLNQNFIKAANKFLMNEIEPWESEYFLKEDAEKLCKKDSILTTKHEEAWREIRRRVSSLAEIKAHCRFAPFINIVTLFEEGLQSYKERHQIIFIEDLALLLGSFLSKKGIVPEIYFYLGDRISHFFIDEFQDTSLLQWQNLYPLIEETLSKKGSLFYVGDKKQAIYGFRGGESTLFDKAKYDFLSVEEKSIKEEFSKINYRSRANIVGFINEIFSSDNLTSWIDGELEKKKDTDFDLPLLLETYAHVNQGVPEREESKDGLIRVERALPDESLKKEELDREIGRRLVSLIQNDIISRYSYGEIAILVRTNTEASLITEILTGANIPVASERTLSIRSNYLVQEIVSLLKFLDSPIDNFAFASFISGEIFLKVTALSQETIHSFFLENRKPERPLYVIFRKRFPEIWQDHLEEYFNIVGFLPPYDLVSRFLKRYHVFQDFGGDEGFFLQLLEVLKGREAEGKNSLKAFLDLWDKEEEKGEEFQVVLPGYTNAIKVLTIHKAKGLGFPVVISPFTYIENKPILQIHEREGKNLIPYRINQRQVKASSKLKGLYQKVSTAQLIEELNTFYVLLTRAEDELYIFLPNYTSKSMAGKFHAPILLEEAVLEIGNRIDRFPKVLEERRGHIHPKVLNEWQDKLYRPLVNTDELVDTARKRAKERGISIHKFLARIERLNEEWKGELERIFSSLSKREKEIVPLMQNFFDSESLRRWFILPSDVEVFCEREIVDEDGLLHRVDRLLVSPKEVVAIEFKTGEPHSEEHKRQVINYLELLSKVYPDKALEGWLVYVDELIEEKVEWVR